MKNCVKCGNEINEKAKFCSSCGEKQPEIPKTSFCENCGQKLIPNARFCQNCAAPIGDNVGQINQKNYQQIHSQENQQEPKKLSTDSFIANATETKKVINKFVHNKLNGSQKGDEQTDPQENQQGQKSYQQLDSVNQKRVINTLHSREKMIAISFAIIAILQSLIVLFVLSQLIQAIAPDKALDGVVFTWAVGIIALLSAVMDGYSAYKGIQFANDLLKKPTNVMERYKESKPYIIAIAYNFVFLCLAAGFWIYGAPIGIAAVGVAVIALMAIRNFAIQNENELEGL